jgi:hypothetical protein
LSYLAARPSKDAVTPGRQVLTRKWWDSERSKYELLVSEAVEIECERGDPEMVAVRGWLCKNNNLYTRSSSDYEPWEDEILRDVYVTRNNYAAEHGYDLG